MCGRVSKTKWAELGLELGQIGKLRENKMETRLKSKLFSFERLLNKILLPSPSKIGLSKCAV